MRFTIKKNNFFIFKFINFFQRKCMELTHPKSANIYKPYTAKNIAKAGFTVVFGEIYYAIWVSLITSTYSLYSTLIVRLIQRESRT